VKSGASRIWPDVWDAPLLRNFAAGFKLSLFRLQSLFACGKLEKVSGNMHMVKAFP